MSAAADDVGSGAPTHHLPRFCNLQSRSAPLPRARLLLHHGRDVRPARAETRRSWPADGGGMAAAGGAMGGGARAAGASEAGPSTDCKRSLRLHCTIGSRSSQTCCKMRPGSAADRPAAAGRVGRRGGVGGRASRGWLDWPAPGSLAAAMSRPSASLEGPAARCSACMGPRWSHERTGTRGPAAGQSRSSCRSTHSIRIPSHLLRRAAQPLECI